MSITSELAGYSATTSYDKLPADVIAHAKFVLLDELGCMVLGRRLPAGQLMQRHVESLGRSAESTVAGAAVRAAAPLAAMANGAAGHADELDGAHITEGHPGATMVAACLATAERAGASGADLVSALVLSYDIGTRLVDAVGGRYHLLSTRHLHSDFLHTFGAAAGAGRLLGLTEDQHRHAAALAAAQAVSLGAFFEERRHLSKSFTYGHGAYAAVTAAGLAQLGMEGNDHVYDAKHGVLAAWDGRDRAGIVVDGLGDRFAIRDVNFKFYSAGYPIHAPIEAALGLMRDHGLASTDVAAIDIRTTTQCIEVVDRRQMPSICVQDMLPVAMVKGKLGFHEAHDETNLRLPEVVRLAGLITLIPDADMDRDHPRGRGATVTLTTARGAQVSRLVAWPHGHCRAGEVAWDELVAKSHDMIDDVLGPERVSAFADVISRIDEITDLRELTGLLVPTSTAD